VGFGSRPTVALRTPHLLVKVLASKQALQTMRVVSRGGAKSEASGLANHDEWLPDLQLAELDAALGPTKMLHDNAQTPLTPLS
jgi:hypothetical protein